MERESGIRRIAGDIAYGNRFTVFVRVLMGSVLIFSGYFKILDPEAFGVVITRYDIIPDVLVGCTAIIIPPLEMLLGLCMIAGYKTRASAFISMAMMLLFMIFMAVNIARGRNFECGCFDMKRLGLDAGERLSVWLLVRDLIFLLVCTIIFLADRHLLSLEGLIERSRLRNLEETRYQ